DIERRLAQVWERVLGVPSIGVHDGFFELGGDSVQSLQVQSLLAEQGIVLSPGQLFEARTIAGLAAVIAPDSAHAAALESAGAGDPGQTSPAASAPGDGPVPLTPEQRRLLAAGGAEPRVVLLEATAPIDRDRLDEALRRCVQRHDALRLRFVHTGSGWVQRHVPAAQAVPLIRDHRPHIDPTGPDPSALLGACAAALDPEAGPVLVALLSAAAEPSERLALIVHPVICDARSARMLAVDIERAYAAGDGPQPREHQPTGATYRHWAERVQLDALSPDGATRRADFARALGPAAVALPRDRALGTNRGQAVARVWHRLSPAETAAVLDRCGGPGPGLE
ncbi:MAG: phosphopantetheine-binding protein, partial [Myxococcota bacterium]